jgi:hypothetical protein
LYSTDSPKGELQLRAQETLNKINIVMSVKKEFGANLWANRVTYKKFLGDKDLAFRSISVKT